MGELSLPYHHPYGCLAAYISTLCCQILLAPVIPVKDGSVIQSDYCDILSHDDNLILIVHFAYAKILLIL